MNSEENNRLSRVNTRITLIRESKHEDPEISMSARVQFFQKYEHALKGYLFALAKGNLELAEEAHSELKLKFIEGKLSGYDKDKGLFRNYLKVIATNLMNDLKRKGSKRLIHEIRSSTIDDNDHQSNNFIENIADKRFSNERLYLDIDTSLGMEYEKRAWQVLLKDEKNKPKNENKLLFLDAIRRYEKLPKTEKNGNENLIQYVSDELGIIPTLSNTAFRSRKSRAERSYWSRFLDEVYESCDHMEPDIELIRIEICEMGYWDKIGSSTWEHWKKEYTQ